MDANPDEAAIAEFHRAARRRNVRIYGIAALVCVAIGIAIIVVGVIAGDTTDQGYVPSYSRARARSGEVRSIVYGLAFVVAGLGAAWRAIRIGRGGQMG